MLSKIVIGYIGYKKPSATTWCGNVSWNTYKTHKVKFIDLTWPIESCNNADDCKVVKNFGCNGRIITPCGETMWRFGKNIYVDARIENYKNMFMPHVLIFLMMNIFNFSLLR